MTDEFLRLQNKFTLVTGATCVQENGSPIILFVCSLIIQMDGQVYNIVNL